MSEYYDDFTNNPLPHNATAHFTPLAAPYALPWWTSIIGGIVTLFIALNNYISVYRRHIVYYPPPPGSQRFNLFTPGGRHFTLALFGLVYTFAQTICGLLHLAIEHGSLDCVQHVSGGGFINVFASIGTVHNPTIRTIPALSIFAVVNAVLSILHFALLCFLPRLGTSAFWRITSNACIADICDVTSPDPPCTFKAGPGLFGGTLEAATCINGNATATEWGHAYGGELVVKYYTLFLVIAFALTLGIMVLGEIYLYYKGDFAPTTYANDATVYHGVQQSVDEERKIPKNTGGGPRPQVMKVNVWFTFSAYPMGFGIVTCCVLAALTWYHGWKTDHSTLQLIVTICPTVGEGVRNVPKEALSTCQSVGFVHGMTVGVVESIKSKGAAMFLRLVYNF
jgi:hypothetical protein